MVQFKRRFFIALLPPHEIQQYTRKIQQHFAEVYNSRAAQKSPPHITLQPPFEWEMQDFPKLEQILTEFARTQAPIPMILDGFAAFKPRVIFINVLKTPELLAVQKALMDYLESSLGIVDEKFKNRPFAPHLTVAYRDLTKPNFYKAWDECKQQKVHFEFLISQLTLLIHNGKCWEISKEFLFTNQA
ncbi:2'-5' RNA ligase [Pleurocapsa sp. PCC 7327]|uniref:2'-5' RNA ligase family protein n=1 Tax=Pleurocapsa sp. PCC 7327 TaxID=118163 RepID=UPI00029FD991|nr:2'-5' RNA ligase family protein [Pleurocapsa sp. PCC 7327]AFY75830.1 2'-5' RNA ligase [Pleurocapsa sp. PCC 7327]